jgi:hypothetical protein
MRRLAPDMAGIRMAPARRGYAKELAPRRPHEPFLTVASHLPPLGPLFVSLPRDL